MATKTLPPQSLLLQLLRYDAETGKLFWRERSAAMFTGGFHDAETQARRWNTRFAGKEALTATSAGYRFGAVNDALYLAHRIIWRMVYGIEPEIVDHINGDRTDNRITNLRDVDPTASVRNTKRPSHNTSGHSGVSYDSRRNKWAAYITLADKKKSLGSFDAIEDAITARKAAESKHGFHPNHGRE